jgi:hypothetical protein
MSRLIVRDNKMKIRLTEPEFANFLDLAEAKAEKFSVLSPDGVSPYGFNHAHSHLVGLAAEYAAHVLFQEIEKMTGANLSIDPAYMDERREGECDIYVGGQRIEVKGIKYGSWLRYGPCISSRQLPKIQRKADIVLWALFNERIHEFTFEGYNKVDQIHLLEPVLTGPDNRPKIENYPVSSIMSPLQELRFQ